MLIRVPEHCEHRRARAESTSCALLAGFLNGLSEDSAVVSHETCHACCSSFLPTQHDLNPVVASILWSRCDLSLTDARVQANVELVARLQHTRNFAEANLPVVLADEDDLPAPPLAPPQTRGTVQDLCGMLPVPDGPGRAIKSWAVGITTAPRRQGTLEQCLTSLTLCGWDALHLFVDGDVQIPEAFASATKTQRRPAAGAWRNFYLSITELLRRCPEADALMLVQDDALWPAHLPVREYLQQIPWPEDGRFIISPYCCADYTADSPGWHRFTDTWHYGAVVMIFSRKSAEEFIADSVVD